MHKSIKTLSIASFLLLIILNQLSAQKYSLDLQGHRGCRGLMPENTIAAMIKAIDLGVSTIEMDVVITKDRKVILSHDHFMNPEYVIPPEGKLFSSALDKSHRIFEMEYEEIKKWNVGSKGNDKFPDQMKIPAVKPLLEVLIDSVETYTRYKRLKPIRYNIETKSLVTGDGILHPDPEAFVDLLMAVIQKSGISRRTTIQSFDKRTIQVMHKKYPDIRTSYLIGASVKSSIDAIIEDLGFRPDIISPEIRLVTPEFLVDCKKEKVRVVVWTVNEIADIKKMADMGVDGIISDYPDRFSVLKK